MWLCDFCHCLIFVMHTRRNMYWNPTNTMNTPYERNRSTSHACYSSITSNIPNTLIFVYLYFIMNIPKGLCQLLLILFSQLPSGPRYYLPTTKWAYSMIMVKFHSLSPWVPQVIILSRFITPLLICYLIQLY